MVNKENRCTCGFVVRPSVASDVDVMLRLVEEARGIMRSCGNKEQWVNGYPSRDVLEHDVVQGVSFMVEDAAGHPVGTFAFIPGPEPTYADIYEGSWLDAGAYHVIHRIATTATSHGVLAAIIAYCCGVSPHLRIDTHRDNAIMRHLLPRMGFDYCGIIYLANGDERLAYERLPH